MMHEFTSKDGNENATLEEKTKARKTELSKLAFEL
jgi:hypothetical protein